MLKKREEPGQRKSFKSELTRKMRSRTQMQFLSIFTKRVVSKVLHRAQKIAYADIEKHLLGDKLADITELAEIRKLLSLDKLTNISRNTCWLCRNRVMTEINASGLLVIIEKQHPLTISQFHLQQNKHNGPEKN